MPEDSRQLPRQSACEHHWSWRRRRNQDFGYWECPRCGLKTDRVPLDEKGRAALTPEEALAG